MPETQLHRAAAEAKICYTQIGRNTGQCVKYIYQSSSQKKYYQSCQKCTKICRTYCFHSRCFRTFSAAGVTFSFLRNRGCPKNNPPVPFRSECVDLVQCFITICIQYELRTTFESWIFYKEIQTQPRTKCPGTVVTVKAERDCDNLNFWRNQDFPETTGIDYQYQSDEFTIELFYVLPAEDGWDSFYQNQLVTINFVVERRKIPPC